MAKRWVGVPFENLMLQTITSVEGLEGGSDEVVITIESGRKFRMIHHQDCCESVELIDFDGDESDLVGGVVVRAEEVVGETPPDSAEHEAGGGSVTWTFYKLDTNKGGLTMRWLGESNGYYSEEVSFEEYKEV